MNNLLPKRNIKIIPCTCPDVEHHILIERHDWGEDYPDPVEYTIHATLEKFHFTKRLWLGIKYILGIENNGYYYFDVLLSEEEYLKISHYFDDEINGAKNEKNRKSEEEVKKV